MEQKRITWIDGLRGFACIFIVLHHFILGYYPAAYFEGGVSHFVSGIDTAFAQSPLGFFATGDLWVSVFCMVSGFVIAHQVWRMTEDKQLSKALLKRYPRLMLPVLALSIIVFVMLQLDWFYNRQAVVMTQSEWLGMFYQDKSGLGELFTSSVIDTWLVGMQLVYSNAFWMLNELFAGSFMAYILALMGKDRKKRMAFVYLFVFAIYSSTNSRMANFALGVLAAFLFVHFGKLIEERKKVFWCIGGLLLVIAFFLGGYPVACEPTNGYRFLAGIAGRLKPHVFYHQIASFCLVMGIGMIGGLQKALSSRPCRFIGKISYSVFLIHIPVLFSITAFVFVKSVDAFGKYNLAALIALLVTYAVVILLSWLFYEGIEKNCTKFTDWVVNLIVK